MQRAVGILIGVQLVDAIGLGLLLPVLPYFVQEYGATAVEVTQLVALYSLANMLFSSSLGRLSDTFGRKPLVLVCTFGSCVAYLAYLFVDSLWMIFAVRLLSGALSAKGGIINAWLIDLVDDGERARYLGLLGSMNGIGMFIGPVLASLLIVGSGELYGTVFIGGALLSIVAGLGVLFIYARHSKPIDHQAPPVASVAAQPKYLDLLALNFSIFLVFSVVFSTSAIYMQARFQWDVGQVGLAIGVMTASVAIARAFLAHRILSVLGERRATWLAGVIMALSLLLSSVSPSPLFFMPFYCLAAAAYAVAGIGVTVQLADRLAIENRGVGMGRLGAASSAAIVFGAATHGYLFELVSPAAPFQLYGVVVAIYVTGWYLITTRTRARSESHGQA